MQIKNGKNTKRDFKDKKVILSWKNEKKILGQLGD